MRRAVLMLVWVTSAACGGAASAVAGPGPGAPSAPSGSPAVRELAAAADTVCACADTDCAQAAMESLLTRQAELENPGDRAGIDAAHDRGIVCYAKQVGVPLGGEVVPFVERAADEVCACADQACAQAAVERLRPELQARQDAVFTSVEQAAVDRAGQRLDACGKRLGETP